jgi:outer membrane protein assembly factor BamB
MAQRRIIVVILSILFVLIPYALLHDARLFAINAETGQVVWSKPLYNDNTWTSSPQVEGSRIFVWTEKYRDEQQLFAFDSLSGKSLWHLKHKREESYVRRDSRPLNFGGDLGVYHDKGTSEFVAVALGTGEERWRVAASSEYSYILSNPDLDKVIVAEVVGSKTSTGSLKAYTLTGKLLWDVPTTVYTSHLQSSNPDSIVGDDENIYIGLQESISKLNSKTGNIIFKTNANVDNGFFLRDRILYGAWASRLSAVDAATGKILWQYNEQKSEGALQSPVVGDKIFLTYSVSIEKPHSGSWLLAINKEGKEIWRKAISPIKSDPSIAFEQIPALISGGVAVIGEDALLAFDDRGNERWRSPLNARSRSAISKDGLVYVTASVPRYAYWQAYINPFRR